MLGSKVLEKKPLIPPGLAAPGVASAHAKVHFEKANIKSRLKHEGSFSAIGIGILGLSFAKPYLLSKGIWISIPCLFKTITHLPCLTCGLTRSFSLMADWKVSEAFKMHLLGPPLFFMTILFTIYFLSVVLTGTRIRLELSSSARRWLLFSGAIVLVVPWLIKLVFMRSFW
ncbi:MAG: DUF2752 domain-containing protein [Actinomycetota bacterium]|nr:DUF2752 domain-containing protein [Actinomycetota bacterium]